MNIVLCADEGYARYAAVVMASAIANASNPERLCFFVLTTGLEADTQERLRDLVEEADAAIHISQVDVRELQGLKTGRFGIAALLPLLMHRYLPGDCERVIYLDCDVLVLGDLAGLWSMPLEGYVAAAAMDLCNSSSKHTRGAPDNYFNSGVILVDLMAWRRERVAEKALECLQTDETARYPDQDALNQVLNGKWRRLEPEWNFQPTAYAAMEKRYAHLTQHLPYLEAASRGPQIVHFIGAVKPWHARCVHPFQDDFLAYSQQTPWPIEKAALRATLPWGKRIRLILKQPKIRRRRMLARS
ncbi:glycosyltransferase family 8 protein [Chromohalobacter nigrandesensis]|uniref:glycosyltransferase family 8 protein n=1 Tax=Chromohalobacter nigrandesensis TaxID=119863 RepID=UPI001FF3A4A1|nr:glycosyltransferase family 8 protein [Chromohalobacter nigrandesensis]MCK0743666.1 glycosyltransferase family 8 protein [Chromohalobacter nigrandesensis]